MNKKFLKVLDDIMQSIKDANKIYIGSHINPDGDSVGSTLALTLALMKINKDVTPLLIGEIPSDYKFLPRLELYEDYGEELHPIDLFIAVDSADADRLGKNKPLLDVSKNIVNIDHHISNTKFGMINLVDDKAAATGELIYHIIKAMGVEIDIDMATCLYTAISTDTGRFMYDNVTDQTHEIIADLIRIGIDKGNINIQLYSSRSMEKTRLFIDVLSTLNLYNNDKIAIVHVTQKMLEETGTSLDDTEGIISFVREIEPVEVACILKESEELKTKISMRSKKYINVSEIANNFNGGGHIRAAGGTIYENINDAEAIVVNKIKEYFR